MMQTSQAEFAACIRDRFQVCPDEGSKAVAFQLAEVKECGSDGSRECFSLLFQGPAFPLLPQKLYRFQHERLGTAHLFVVPIEEVREGIQYEVIFNRRICLDAFPEIRTGPSADRKGDCDRTVYRGNSHVWRKLCAAGLGVLQRSAARRRPKQSSVFRVGPDLRRRRANDFCASRFAGTGTDASGSRTGTYPRSIGVTGGDSTVTLDKSQMPGHKHVPLKQSVPDQKSPIAAIWADTRGRTAPHIYNDSANMTTMNEQAMQRKGGGQPHNNMQPYLGLSFIIALEGIYPNRS